MKIQRADTNGEVKFLCKFKKHIGGGGVGSGGGGGCRVWGEV